MSTRVTSTRFVGRTGEQAELLAGLRDADAGRPSLVLVAGESGVGKTRLVAELEREARTAATPALVLGGDCLQLGTGELPYAPLVAALRPLARRDDPVLAALPPATRAELARFLPSLGAATAPAEHPADDDAGQGRLFEALLTLFDALSRDRPLLLVIEDLHWADRSTRAFLGFLVRSLCNERILVVGTYRPDELHRRHPLRPLLAELERDPASRRIELAPLTRDELGEQLADILGAPAADDLLDRLWARSEGNPLFSEELLAAGLDGRGALPPTLRDALMLRIEELPAEAQELLRVLAVGQRVHHTVLAAAVAVDARTLRDALREAVAGQIVVADEDGRYRFRHALLREVVEDDLLPGERAELHLVLARALEARIEQVGADVQLVSGIAHHYAAGGDQPAALEAAVRAAAEAEAVMAYGEKADLLERALALWPNVDDAERRAGRSRRELLHQAAVAHEIHGDHARAESLLVGSLALIDAEAEPRRAAATLERLARVRWALMRPDDALETGRRGLALVAGERCVERARLLGWWAKARMLQGRYREAIETARETIELAAELGDETAESRARNALGVSLAASGDAEGGARELRRAISLAGSANRRAELGSGYVNLSDALHLLGRTREALAVLREGIDVPAPHSTDRLWMRAAISEFSLAVGEWEQAAEQLPPLRLARSGNARLNVGTRHIELALARGEDARARELLELIEPLAEDSAEPQSFGPIAIARAELELRAGDIDAGRRAIDAALDRIEFCADDVARIAHVAAVGVAVEAEAAQRARDVGAAGALTAALERAERLIERLRAVAGDRPVENAWRATAEAELLRARGNSDPAAWRAAETAWLALEYPYPAARARWRGAEAQVVAGDRTGATASVRAAITTARALGAGRLVGAIEGLAARARLALDDDPPPTDELGSSASPKLAAPEPLVVDPFGLTPRERQVLELVADGATNRQIGEQLFMAEKTASVHVSRILAKLDVRSRTEAAAVAHRVGLAAGGFSAA